MAQQYLVHLQDGTEYGPVDRATLAAWHAEGRLPDGTLVWPEGAPEWMSVPVALGSGAAPVTATQTLMPSASTPAVAPPSAVPPSSAAAPAPAAAPLAGRRAGAGPSTSGRSRPVRPTSPIRELARPAARPASAFPFRPVLLVGGALVGLLVLVALLWAVARPWVEKRYAIASIERQASAERRIEDRDSGLVLDLPAGWVALRPGNPWVPAPDARVRLAQPLLQAFASVSVAARPRLMDQLDARLDELLQERLPRQPSTKETGRADVQLGRGRGRLVRTRWDDGLSPMQGAIVTWADGYDLFALDAWAPASAGPAFAAAVDALCRGVSQTGVLGRRVDEAVDRLSLEVPELPRDSLRLLVAERMSRGRPLDDVPQAALLAVSRGLDALDPAEASEMRSIYQRVWAPVPEAERVRLAALLNAFKAGRQVPAADLAQVRAALNAGVLALAPEERERLQALSGRAVRKALLAP